MPWFKFDKDYDYRPVPKGSSLVAYKAGMHLNIPEAAAKAAELAGRGERSKHAPKAGDRTDGKQAVRPRADGQNSAPSNEELGENDTPAGSTAPGNAAGGSATPAGATPSAT